jgi:predicted nucleic acid-binding protein
MPNSIVPANGCCEISPPPGPALQRVPALFDTGALELLRRRNRRVEALALKHFPPVVCAQVVGEYLHAQFHSRVDDPTLLAARIFLAPFEMLVASAHTPDLCAQLRAAQQAGGNPVPEVVCWIAAHALEHGLPVVTTDRQFRRLPGLQVLVVVPFREPNSAEKRRPALAGRL